MRMNLRAGPYIIVCIYYSLIYFLAFIESDKKSIAATSLVEKDKDLKIHPTKGGRCITEYLTYDW